MRAHSVIVARALALASAFALASCGLGPPRSTPVQRGHQAKGVFALQIVSDDCPVGFIKVRASSVAREGDVVEGVTDATGVAHLVLGRGAYRAVVSACGRTGAFSLDARASGSSYRLPDRDDRSLPRAPWGPSVERLSRSNRAPCRFPSSRVGTRLLAGDYRLRRVDGHHCALHLDSAEASWLYHADGSLLRLGTTTILEGERFVVASEGSSLVTVDRKTGAPTFSAGAADAVGLSRHTDVLLFSRHFDPVGERMSLDAHWPDGRTRHLSDRAHTHATFSADGQWLAFLDLAASSECPMLHLVDVTRAEERAVRRVCRTADLYHDGLPRILSPRHVFVPGRDAQLVLDARTGEVVLDLPASAHVRHFSRGLVVRGDGLGAGGTGTTIWSFDTGARIELPLRFDDVLELPTHDLLLSRRAGAADRFDFVFVDVLEGKARTIAEGVSRRVMASEAGVVVFEEEARFVAAAIGGGRPGAFPRTTEAIESLSDDGRWAALRAPETCDRRSAISLAPIDGRSAAQDVASGEWARDRAAYVFTDGPRSGPSSQDPIEERSQGRLRARFVETGLERVLAERVGSALVLDDGQIVYSVPGDGIYLTAVPR